jgi:LPPG:FO 2-phospho-L-lactate transferase
MKLAALAGGVGGSKMLIGLAASVDDNELTAIVNTADDDEIYGLHVSPDVDIVTYWLSGLADRDRGWGLAGDSFTVLEAMSRLGIDTWFKLGDGDLATCLMRTQRLREGASLSVVTDEIRRRLQISVLILPMSDDRVRTRLATRDGRILEFQQYFVRERQEPTIERVWFDGIDAAKPAPGVLEALHDADRIVICPSNPVVSIGPILALPEVRETLRAHSSVIAVSPLVRGAAIKGPADKLLPVMNAEVSSFGVAELYADFCDVFVLDNSDEDEVDRIETLGMDVVALDTIMADPTKSEQLAREILEL